MGYPLDSAIMSYYSDIQKLFVYVGNDPVPKSAFIPTSELLETGRLTIRVRRGAAKDDNINTITLRLKGKGKEIDGSTSPKSGRRTKERKIGYIIEKVSLWRKLYNGVADGHGTIVKYSLEDSAKYVGISKKSLDDYLLQLRVGRKFGFNFNHHKDEKVGVLRAFVKKHKDGMKTNLKSPMQTGNKLLYIYIYI